MLVRGKTYLLAPAFTLSQPRFSGWTSRILVALFACHESFSPSAVTLGACSLATPVRGVSMMY